MKPIDKNALFEFLAAQPPEVLLGLLQQVYENLERDDRQAIFGKFVPELTPNIVDGDALLDEIKEFQRASLAGYYYEEFNINSKNWRHIPEETQEWFDLLGQFLASSTQLTRQGDHVQAVVCFEILYALIGKMEYGDEIVFGDEIGSWMIPGDEKEYLAAYIESLAAVSEPKAFAAAAASLIKRDGYQSFAGQSYASAMRLATPQQMEFLETEIERQKIKKPRS